MARALVWGAARVLGALALALVASVGAATPALGASGTVARELSAPSVDNCTEGGLQLFASVEDLRIHINGLPRSELSLGMEDSGVAIGVTAASAPSAGSPAAESAAPASESITNNQEEGVDEGGIVKAQGEFLVVLRRGRLFTARLGDDALEPVSTVDANGPGTLPATWYDEMLVFNGTVVVIGFSYQAGHGGGATEIGLFSLDADGRLAHRSSYYLRSNDYYSSRNYASRLVGSRLVLYMPHQLARMQYSGSLDGVIALTYPTLCAVGQDDWAEIMTATDVYQPLHGAAGAILHTVITCDLAGATASSTFRLQCTARGVLGPQGRVYYVAQEAVYVWVAAGSSPAILYRLPLAARGENGSTPSALRVSGAPVDQFSFKDEGSWLSVLVRADAVGDGMWGAEASAGSVSLMRVPLTLFKADLDCSASAAHFTAVPTPPSAPNRWSFQNRHVGDFVLYGLGAGWGGASDGADDAVYVYDRIRGGAATRLRLPHAVDRIEALGTDAIAIGGGGSDLYFSSIILGTTPQLGGRLVRRGATQGETRSHGFFYKPHANGTGTLGLPVRGAREPGWSHLVTAGASVLYLRVADHEFTSLGELRARDGGAPDNCSASCVDWYGNSRPLFYRGRVLALLGYELVEGKFNGDQLEEARRTHLLPAACGTMSAGGIGSLGEIFTITAATASALAAAADVDSPTAGAFPSASAAPALGVAALVALATLRLGLLG